jgi:DNA-binding NarL/FixJ family response regulator
MRVVIGEDEALLREGLRLVLARGRFDVVAATADALELSREARRLRPDLVITDICMPPGRTDDGLRAALEIRASVPGTAVVVLSQYLQREYALELLADARWGVGYLLKQRIADVAGFCRDLELVCAGATILDPEVVALMVQRARAHQPSVDRLTDRQREVLGLMAEGRSNAAIARALGISEKAVVNHISHIYDEIGLPVSADDHRRVLAVLRYLSG